MNRRVVDVIALREQKSDITDSEKILLILVRQMIHPETTITGLAQIGVLNDQLATFPCADKKERLVSATTIATWVMMLDLSYRR
jgi:hypothetical protein